MNVLTGDEKITVDSYEISFSEPRSYTVLQVKRDRFAFLALIGSVILLAGLFLAFYLRPQRVWAVREEGGWTLRGFCRKGGVLFREALTEAVGAPPEDPEALKPTEEEENDDAAG